jgi:hypothetical protein
MEARPVSNTFQNWVQQGESLYTEALEQFHQLEVQLADLERQLVEKQEEVNRIAQMIGKPPVEGTRRASSNELVPATIVDEMPRAGTSNSNATIARALTGRFGR